MKVDWFSRGRDAFTEGEPCFFKDGRVSGKDRAAWYDGWKHQRNLNTQPALREQLDQTIEDIGEILEAIRKLP